MSFSDFNPTLMISQLLNKLIFEVQFTTWNFTQVSNNPSTSNPLLSHLEKLLEHFVSFYPPMLMFISHSPPLKNSKNFLATLLFLFGIFLCSWGIKFLGFNFYLIKSWVSSFSTLLAEREKFFYLSLIAVFFEHSMTLIIGIERVRQTLFWLNEKVINDRKINFPSDNSWRCSILRTSTK